MNVLIVYAHPDELSFNHAMMEAARTCLTEAGHAVEVSDLYAMGFNPVASLSDVRRGAVAPDVAEEHRKLFQADLIIFQFPIWWGTMPAILKGWVDRVFTPGIIYGRGTKGLDGRKVLVSVTASHYPDRDGAIDYITRQLSHVFQNMLALSRLQVLEPHFVFGPRDMSDTERDACLRAYQHRLRELCVSPRELASGVSVV